MGATDDPVPKKKASWRRCLEQAVIRLECSLQMSQPPTPNPLLKMSTLGRGGVIHRMPLAQSVGTSGQGALRKCLKANQAQQPIERPL